MKPYTATDYEVRAFLEGRKTQLRIPVEPQPEWSEISGTRYFTWHNEESTEGWVMCHEKWFNKHIESVAPYKPGDRLWVREDWAAVSTFDPSPETGALYRSDSVWGNAVVEWEWEAAESMPKWASRITLEVENVRVQKLRDIYYGEIVAEGCEPDYDEFDLRTACMEGWEEPEELIPECEDECDWVNHGHNLVHSREHREWLADRKRYATRLDFENKWNERHPTRPWDANPWVWVFDVKVV